MTRYPSIRTHPNAARYRPGMKGGLYESFFLRANHPTRPLAFWIRYTVFSPAGRPDDAVGELWAVYFDGERGDHVVAKTQRSISESHFGESELHVRVGDALLEEGRLRGQAASADHRVSWDLSFTGDAEPILIIDEALFEGRFPKAKGLVPMPMARFVGSLDVDGGRVVIDGWTGSQNHNWGSKHTDEYAWGQVEGFDDHPQSCIELITGRLRYGPLWTPAMTPLVLRHRGEEFALNTLGAALRNRGRFTFLHCSFFHWEFRARGPDVVVEGSIWAPRDAFVGLTYANPPGGEKHCLNCKLASCELLVHHRREGWRDVLTSRHRAAFEILTDRTTHGVAISA